MERLPMTIGFPYPILHSPVSCTVLAVSSDTMTSRWGSFSKEQEYRLLHAQQWIWIHPILRWGNWKCSRSCEGSKTGGHLHGIQETRQLKIKMSIPRLHYGSSENNDKYSSFGLATVGM